MGCWRTSPATSRQRAPIPTARDRSAPRCRGARSTRHRRRSGWRPAAASRRPPGETAHPAPIPRPLPELVAGSCSSSISCHLRRWLRAAFLRSRQFAGCCAQPVIEVGDDVANVLDADGQADQFRRHSGVALFRLAELLVSGGSGMNHQRLGIADIGQQAEQLQRIDEALAGLEASTNAEGDQRARAGWEGTSWPAGSTGWSAGRDSSPTPHRDGWRETPRPSARSRNGAPGGDAASPRLAAAGRR